MHQIGKKTLAGQQTIASGQLIPTADLGLSIGRGVNGHNNTNSN